MTTAAITQPVADEITTRLTKLAGEISASHTACVNALGGALLHAIRCGKLLIAAKEVCGHGDWLRWVRANTKLGRRAAQCYMRLARREAEIDLGEDRSITGNLRRFAKVTRTMLAPGDDPLEHGDGERVAAVLAGDPLDYGEYAFTLPEAELQRRADEAAAAFRAKCATHCAFEPVKLVSRPRPENPFKLRERLVPNPGNWLRLVRIVREQWASDVHFTNSQRERLNAAADVIEGVMRERAAERKPLSGQ